MNQIELILQEKSIIQSNKLNDLYFNVSVIKESSTTLDEYSISDSVNYTKSRMAKFITATETIFDISDKVTYTYGDLYPNGEFEVINDKLDYLVTHYLDDPFFIVPTSNVFTNYPYPVFTHDVNNYRFNAEGTSQFQVYIKITDILDSGLFYVVDDGTKFIPYKDKDIALHSSLFKTYIKRYTKIHKITELLSDCSEPYAFVVNNNIVPTSEYSISVSSSIREMVINKLTIKNVFIGKNITKFPYTYEMDNPMPGKNVMLSNSTELNDSTINVSDKFTKVGDKIIIVFDNIDSSVKSLKLMFEP